MLDTDSAPSTESRALTSHRALPTGIPWVLLVALLTAALVPLRGTLDKAHVVLLYLMLVLGASARRGRRVGLVVSVLCFLSFNFFLLPPYHTLRVADPLDWLVLFAFLTTSLLAAELLHRAQGVVDDDETFDAVLERHLNEQAVIGGVRYEVLNFAVDGYSPLQELYQLESRNLAFKPAAILYVAHYSAKHRASLHLTEMGRAGVEVPYPELGAILERAGIGPGIGRFESEQRIRPFEDEILSWTYRRMASSIRASGAVPVWVFLPLIGDHVPADGLARLTKVAADAGFETISLADCFAGQADAEVRFGEWDHHPNAVGHRLIAAKLFERLRAGEVLMTSR